MDKQGLKTQIGVSLSLDVVRRAAAAYEMIKSAKPYVRHAAALGRGGTEGLRC